MSRSESGFTFVEISIVVVVLFVISSMVAVNLSSFTRSRAEKDLEANVARLPQQARGDAVRLQAPVQLRVDGTSFIEEKVMTDGQATQIRAVDMGAGMKVDRMQLNGQDSSSGVWKWTAYPDGSSDKGGVEFMVDGGIKSLVMPDTGDSEWITGTLPDEAQDQWSAGQYLQRTSS